MVDSPEASSYGRIPELALAQRRCIPMHCILEFESACIQRRQGDQSSVVAQATAPP